MITKKPIKERKTFTLSPDNIAWLQSKSLQLSTPDDKVSDSELVDRLITQARLADESQGASSPQKNIHAANLYAVIA